MAKKFLENESYTLIVAKVAILFQSFITSAIVTILLSILFGVSYPRTILISLLFVDSMFVITHLSYRKAYRGPKVILRRSEKMILIVHIVTSLLALLMTFIMVQRDLDVQRLFTITALCMWVISLVFGIVFFIKKYSGVRVLHP